MGAGNSARYDARVDRSVRGRHGGAAGRRRRVGAVPAYVVTTVAVLVGGAGLALVAQPVSAALPSACTLSGSTVTCTWTSGSNQFAVPNGVTTLRVLAVGGKGGDIVGGPAGGFGAGVTGDITVTPGTSVFAVVGGNGGNPAFPGPGIGGANGGGAGGGTSAGGGGASDVRTSQADLSTRLIVAAGGGGGGQDGGASGGSGGPGGAAGSAGGTGTNVVSTNNGNADGGVGGGAGTLAVPGAGGAGGDAEQTGDADGCPAADGSLGQGGDGGVFTPDPFCAGGGGGGGGGVYGGGGGGGGASNTVVRAGSGGGGGGSSLVPTGGSFDPDTTTAPKVMISYLAPERVSPSSIDFGSQPLGSASAPTTVTLSSAASLDVSSATLGGTNAGDFSVGSDTCSGQTVPAGGSCTVAVSFVPLATGPRSAVLTFSHTGLTSPQTVALAGNGTTLADVAVTISGPTSTVAGAQNTYVITVENVGPSTARNVVMTTSVPAGTRLKSVIATRGTCAVPRSGASTGAITCSLGDLAKTASARHSVALKITLNAKGGSIALGAHAESTATGNDPATPDPALGNNTASISTPVDKK